MKLSVPMTSRESQLGWCYLVIETFALPGIVQTLNLWLGLGNTALNLLCFGLNFLLVGVIFFRFLRADLLHACKRPWRLLGISVLMFGVNEVVSLALSGLIVRLFPDFANINDAEITQMAQAHYIPMFIGTVLLVPVAEETLFRGLLFGQLLPKSPLLAYCASTLCFALAHVLGYVGQVDGVSFILCLIQYLPAGVCLCFAYQKADSIWAPITIHIAVNFIGMLAMR